MDLFYGIKGILPLVSVILIAAAVTNNDTLTRIILGVLGVGIAVGMTWDPVAKFISGRKAPPRN